MGTALVTGGTNGIGFELAKLLAADGNKVIVVGRDDKRLALCVREFGAIPMRIDLADPDAPEELHRKVAAKKLHVGILINNAGFGGYGLFLETDLAHERQMLQVNVVALTALSKVFGREMKRGDRIMNVASTAAFFPGPLMAVYYASKAYVLSLSVALNEEFRAKGITVTALCPGPTATGFAERASLRESKLNNGKSMSAAEVAAIGYRGMLAGKAVVIPGTVNRLQAFASRLLPRTTLARIVKGIQEERNPRDER